MAVLEIPEQLFFGHLGSPEKANKGKCMGGGGPHSTMDSVLALHPAAPGSILGVPKDFPMEISFDVAEIYRQHCTA